jgi:octaheme c-type cytochrome (tetrathionate reductase family)
MRQPTIAAVAFFLMFLASGAVQAGSGHQERIQGPVTNGPEVTRQCLNCHAAAAHDFLKTAHWLWQREQTVAGQTYARGKRNALNNYCTSVASNEAACSSCHAGYGMVDGNFDFTDPTRIDCLVCHDTTGTYAKAAPGGIPAAGVDLLRVAQQVGTPSRDNCGACHFFGGGGDAVKHGDLDSSMAYPDPATDIHMTPEGNDFPCQNCHQTKNHEISGNSIGVSPGGMSTLSCENCHDQAPHQQSRLNRHTAALSCQSCHIPYYAKEIPTKVWWDWSTAGDPQRKVVKDKFGKVIYVAKKGDMKYDKMIQPEYAWYLDGKNTAYLRGARIDPAQEVLMAGPTASRNDREARIYPFKVMRGKQIYDTRNLTLIAAHLIGEDGFWETFDWNRAAEIGMRAAGLPYSGEYGFISTIMYWRLNHMVSPKAEALSCLACHGDQGRMDWTALGYPGDPMNNPGWARAEL